MKHASKMKTIAFLAISILNFHNLLAQWSGTNPLTTSSNLNIQSPGNDATLDVGGGGDSATVQITTPWVMTGSYVGPFRIRGTNTVLYGPPTWGSSTTYFPLFCVKPNGFVGLKTETPSEMLTLNGGNALTLNGNFIARNGSFRTQNSAGITNFKVDGNGLLIARQIDVHLDPIPDYVFHAAALKQVPSCEFFPDQAVFTNVIGSGNVIRSSVEYSVKSLVCLSTDKAVYPINAMGMTKSLMEKYVLANSRLSDSNKTTLSVTRYGNVMMSRGSVIPLFVKQALSGEKLTLTNPEMTRFLMSLDESVQLVEHAFLNANPGDLFVRKAPACTIKTLASAIWKIVRPGSEPEFNLIGTRHGEKVFESLLSSEEVTQAVEEQYYYRVGMDSRSLDYSLYFDNGSALKIKEPYTSHNTRQLGEDEVVTLLLSLPSFSDLIKSAKSA